MRKTLFFLFLIQISFLSYAQVDSRSGFPSPKESTSQMRMFPCGGETVFSEHMDGKDIPTDWQVLDLDMEPLAGQFSSEYDMGWQSHKDFKNPNNRVLLSPSWYADSSQSSNDWLITPQITLDNNTCLSWYAYSQDQFFPESYEVRISTTTPTADSMGFLANDPLLVVNAEFYLINYRSVNLSEYDGKDVYIAFRHTSKNKFILVLDDVRLGKVQNMDLGATEIEDIDIEPGDSTLIQAAIINYGSEIIQIDSLSPITVNYSINNGPVFSYSFPPVNDTTFLLPNDTVQFTHNVYWKPVAAAPYLVCVWTSDFQDDNIGNDTTCVRVGVGIDITAIGDLQSTLPVSVYPNPVDDMLTLEWESTSSIAIEVYDLVGSSVIPKTFSQVGNETLQLNLSSLAPGIYVVRASSEEGQVFTKKIVKR